MNKSVIVIIITFFLISVDVYSIKVDQTPGSICEFGSDRRKDKIEDWLNNSFEEAVNAIKNGRMVNNKLRKLPSCKIKQIMDILSKVKFEYSCSCRHGCGEGGSHYGGVSGPPFIRISAAEFMYNEKRGIKMDEPPKTICGCIQGLIVHELVHAAGDGTEEGATDCAKLLFPCADDYNDYASDDFCNCNCTPK